MAVPADIDQARELALAHVRAAASILNASDVQEDAVPDCACTDREPPGAISVAARVWVHGVPVAAAVTTLHDHWAAQGCTVLEDGRSGALPTVLVQRPDDIFWLRAMVNPRGELFITASSPCVRPAQP
jgi:hypothetical protein